MLLYPSFHVPIMDWLNHAPAFLTPVTLSALGITLITSVILTIVMVRYKGKRAVDIAVVLRELAIILVLVRLFVALAKDSSLSLLALFIYLFLGFAVTLLLALTIKEVWFPPRVLVLPAPEQLDECHTELKKVKENSHGNEKV